MEKCYLRADEYLRDIFRLARMVYDSGWLPDDLIALWRGGAPVGLGVHEFFRYLGIPVRHHVVKCGSYTGIGMASETVAFEDAEEVFAGIPEGSRVLVLDDVFDSGRTIRAVMDRLSVLNVHVCAGTVYWKPSKNCTDLQPDFYVRKTDEWIVFPHEMEGLTREELRQKDPVLAALLPWRDD